MSIFTTARGRFVTYGFCRSKGLQYSETRTSASERLQGGLAGGRAGSIGRANDQDLLAVSKKEDDHDARGP
jgi:hypothetical protein